jgi:hypothetical protein
MSSNVRAAAYAALVIPTVVWMAWRLYSPIEVARRFWLAKEARLSQRTTVEGAAAS